MTKNRILSGCMLQIFLFEKTNQNIQEMYHRNSYKIKKFTTLNEVVMLIVDSVISSELCCQLTSHHTAFYINIFCKLTIILYCTETYNIEH